MRLNRVKVKTLLAQKDMRQKDIIEISGLTRSTISAVFNGKSCAKETAEKIADSFGVNLEQILE